MHPLDNVIWQALTTRDAQFAESFDEARRFVREVGPLGAFREHSARGYASLAGLVGPGGTIGLFLDDPYEDEPHELRAGWSFVAGAPLLQMVADDGVGQHARPRSVADSPSPDSSGPDSPNADSSNADSFSLELIELGPQDSPEMIELTVLTKPGPFSTRTHELGTYLGHSLEGKAGCDGGRTPESSGAH